MKKVVVISTSLRPGSNSHALAEQFAEGAKSAGNQRKSQTPGGVWTGEKRLVRFIRLYRRSKLRQSWMIAGVCFGSLTEIDFSQKSKSLIINWLSSIVRAMGQLSNQFWRFSRGLSTWYSSRCVFFCKVRTWRFLEYTVCRRVCYCAVVSVCLFRFIVVYRSIRKLFHFSLDSYPTACIIFADE